MEVKFTRSTLFLILGVLLVVLGIVLVGYLGPKMKEVIFFPQNMLKH